MNKTFFLGIGAAKSGTSWLYNYLAAHPEVCPSPIKEMHVLNSPRNQGYFGALKMLPWHRFAGRKWLKENVQKAYYRADWERYFSLYERNLQKGYLATGEISTSYMTMAPSTLLDVKQEFDNRGIRTVGLLLLRDPVDQFISAIRFKKRLYHENRYVKTNEEALNVILEKEMKHNHIRGADSYASAIHSLMESFDASDRFISLYETLFSQSALDELCDCIGVSRKPADFSKRVNATVSTEDVSLSVLNILRERFDPAYLAAEAHFGKDVLSRAWRYKNL